jgi:thiol-disulfide isomerase/thioredoxin
MSWTNKIDDCQLPIAEFLESAKPPIANCKSTIGNRNLAILLLAFCCCFLFGCNGNDIKNSNDTPVISGPPPGTSYPMPPLKGTSIVNMGWDLSDGKRALFSDYKGRVLILDFYATWCVPCRDSVPHLMGLHKKYEHQGLSIVGLNVGGPEDEAEVPGFAKEFGIQYALGKPDEVLVGLLLSDTDSIPQTFVFDRQGQLVDRLIGFGEGSGERLDLAVESALKTAAP